MVETGLDLGHQKKKYIRKISFKMAMLFRDMSEEGFFYIKMGKGNFKGHLRNLDVCLQGLGRHYETVCDSHLVSKCKRLPSAPEAGRVRDVLYTLRIRQELHMQERSAG